MRFWTHLSAGILIAAILCKIGIVDINISQGQAILLLIIAGSLMPDIDSGKARMGRLFSPLAKFFRHRGFFHTPFCCLLLTFLLYIFCMHKESALVFSAGYFSHLLLDMLNPKGIKLIYPFSDFTVRGNLQSRSEIEYAILAVIISFIILLVFL